jgi:hypothetical protein
MIGGFLQMLARLPAALFFELMFGAPVLGTVLFLVALALLTKKHKIGYGFVVLGIGGWIVGAALFIALVSDLACTGRSGAWIC